LSSWNWNPHGGGAGPYRGFNRLWYDGHVFWHQDTDNGWWRVNQTLWAAAESNNQGNWGGGYCRTWAAFDAD